MDGKISIIIPCYNVSPWLPRCLDSILVQTYGDIEIIVVNDGSKDATAAVIDAYAAKDHRIKAIHKENGGVTSARLRGVAEATGEWIGFVDGDDYIEPQMYEHLLKNALKYTADISHCGYRMVFPNRVDYYYNTGRLVQQDRASGLNDLIRGQFVEPGLWNKLYRRELFEPLLKENRMRLDIRINEDLLMNYWLFKSADRSVYEDVCPYHYILRKGSAANSKLNVHKLRDPLQVTRILLEDAPREAYPAAFEKLVRQLVSGASMDLNADPALIRPYRTETRKELRSRLREILRSDCGRKLKLQALWAGIWPGSYSWVHRVYLKVTRLDKLYDFD